MPADAAHVPHGSCPRRSSSTDTILYIHTVFQPGLHRAGNVRTIATSVCRAGPKPLLRIAKRRAGK
ncbi:hypothetical protein C6Q14_15545 [Burkholderia ambifaria]|nr:hypothetical protein C6Q14_15545 [Burkholderia ambifaria]